ncbi:MAG: hypothetical protein JWM27_4878 [Gemmatimonadetes bacterium]|nr:hypothetical protein [Gemmatimonadota bacterium]
MKRPWESWGVTGVMCAAALGVLAVGAHRELADGQVHARLSRAVLNQVLPSGSELPGIQLRPGTRHRELVAVLIATSECIGTRNPDFVPAVRAMKAELARRAAAQGLTLRLVGVALDDQVADGLGLLNRVGPFHEVSAGGNWLNTDAVAYIWRNRSHSTSVPQWVLLERDVALGRSEIGVAPDHVIAVVAGADKMRAWVRASRAEVPPVGNASASVPSR